MNTTTYICDKCAEKEAIANLDDSFLCEDCFQYFDAKAPDYDV